MLYPVKTPLLIAGLMLGGALAGCASTATHESTGAYVDDASISTKVKTAILGDDGLKGSEIHVATDRDVVELSGFVDSPSMIARASAVANGVAGVRGVRNDLVVK